MPEYSANMISHSFWQDEFTLYIDFLNDDFTDAEIRKMAVEDNCFQQKTEARSIDTYRTLKRRIGSLDDDYLELYPSLDVSNKKLVNIISIMLMDKLFDEFMYEVFREEIMLGDSMLHDYEIEAFFTRKQVESDQVANWSDQTITRLTGLFKTFNRNAGLMIDKGSYDEIVRPFLDFRLEDLLQEKKQFRQLASLTGR
ncbi:DUF1819 family protein [Companilactobacillus ginsenosidimutans]|uniref:DUF1819 family protein n=1 Tax=Companilactobacillus ginsenosidimutans TaxID=1007676 RepID=A0A0H4R0D4_9LACO|nr:DUF1819 family protein [Companilactobacillus ginsenosidimutans]AKP67180.1 hypothetical protein ABM34_06270 [Companilactobacillus ginsenosidimutans]